MTTTCDDPAEMEKLSLEIRSKIEDHFFSLDATCNNDGCPRGDLAGCLVRLTGHDIMDGSADGCVDFTDMDNNGLKGCMLEAVDEVDSSNVSLDLLWQPYCTRVSVADFFVITAEALMTVTAPEGQLRNMWRNSFTSNFRFGRSTSLTCSPDPLPHPGKACDAVDEVFIQRMGLNARQATALMGVHTLGRALPSNSGFDGWWVSQEHAKTFSAKYFARLLNVGWKPKNVGTAQDPKWQWVRADVEPPHPLADEMMLNTDMCLAAQVGGFPCSANSGGCAPWTRAEDPDNNNFQGRHGPCCIWLAFNDPVHGTSPHLSGITPECQAIDLSEGATMGNCCRAVSSTQSCEGNNPSGQRVRTDSRWAQQGHAQTARDAVVEFAQDVGGDEAWNTEFMQAWTHATERGFSGLCSAA